MITFIKVLIAVMLLIVFFAFVEALLIKYEDEVNEDELINERVKRKAIHRLLNDRKQK